MIGTNLATRPFYNERIIRACITALGVLVAAATIFNGVQVLRYGRNEIGRAHV